MSPGMRARRYETPQTSASMITKSIGATPRPACFLCGSPGRPVHTGLRDRLFGAPGEWDLDRCENRDCGLYWLNPMPATGDISAAYESYYTHACAAVGDVNARGRWEKLLRRLHEIILDLTSIARARRAALDLYLDDARPGRVLDVGCGQGRQLLRLKAMGWQVEGQEIDPDAGAHHLEDSDIRVYQAPLEDLHLAEGRYDAIVMNHVIEHAADPLALVRECRRLLKREGQLVVVTPNTGSLGHRLFGDHWRPLEPPRHLFLFSDRNLVELSRQAGFSKAEVWTSAANAAGFVIESWNLLRHGTHRVGAAPSNMARLVGFGFLIAASIAIKAWPRSGEEAVLRAWKEK